MASPIPPLPPAPNPGSVLVIEPDRPWAEAVCGALRDRGLAPASVATSEEARWRLHERRFDLLILSTSADHGTFETLLHELRDHGAPPPVLLIEDHRGGGFAEAWRFLRAARTLRRPCRLRDVADAATSLIGRAGAERRAMA